MTKLTFERRMTHVFNVDVPLPAEVQLELDAGQSLNTISDAARAALFDYLGDTAVFPDTEAVDVIDVDVTITRADPDLGMLGVLIL